MNFENSTAAMNPVRGRRSNLPPDYESFDPSRPQDVIPEYGLVQAVLREAIREYQKFAGKRGRRGSRLFREVRQWFSENDTHWDFSFINVCQILDLEPAYIRTGLKLWSDRNVGTNTNLDVEKPEIRRRSQENLAPGSAHIPALR